MHPCAVSSLPVIEIDGLGKHFKLSH